MCVCVCVCVCVWRACTWACSWLGTALRPVAAMYVLPMVLIFSTPLNFGLDSSWEATTVRQLLRRVPIQAEHSLDTLSMDTAYSPFDLGLRGGKNTACISQRACPQNEMQYDDLLPINMN